MQNNSKGELSKCFLHFFFSWVVSSTSSVCGSLPVVFGNRLGTERCTRVQKVIAWPTSICTLGTKIAVPETVVAPCKRTAGVKEGNFSSAGGKKKKESLLKSNRDSSMLFYPLACILLVPI